MAAPVDPTRTAAPVAASPVETQTGDSAPVDSTSTGTYQPLSAIYRDFTPHARGGIGEVLRATEPALNRTVAVKRLQLQRASNPESRRRFLVEAEVTARLEHPGVVPVYALFTDERGGPAYAMRFVQGPTLWDAITEYHAGPSDSVAFRRLLQSFLQVCQTVAYAHTRGVIHRDLKPQNILLGKFGETLVVDWGLAKVVGRNEDIPTDAPTEGTLVPGADASGSETAMGSAVGTPSYMSPEQAAGRWDVVTQPSDVYSLGAVLYTLLTGRPPLENGNWPEMQQRIQQGDFPRPRQIRADTPHTLEAVCLKAMALSPAARYSSAEALAADIEHWMADEPIEAKRDGVATRIRRWAKRNRMVVSGAAVLLVAAVVGLSIGAVLLGTKNREVGHQRQAAETAQRKAEAINRFLIDDLLKQADPVNNQVGDRLTVRELLDKAGDKLDSQTALADQPEVEAEIREVVGHAYEYLAVNDKAERHFRRAWDLLSALHGPDDPPTLAVRNRFVRAYVTQGRRPEAVTHALSAFETCERVFGEDNPETAEAANNLAEAYFHQSRFDEVVALRRRASRLLHAALGPNAEKTLEIDNDLAVALVTAGCSGEAVPLLYSVVERRRRINPRNPELASNLGNLGGALIGLGRFTDAESVLREAVELSTEMLGPDNGRTLAHLNLWSYALEGQERWAEAEVRYTKVLASRRQVRGPLHYETQRTLAFLARLSAKQERWKLAASYLAELILAETPDPGRTTMAVAATLTDALEGKSDPVAAEPLLRECHQILDLRMWKGDWLTAEVSSRHGDCLRRQGEFKRAKPILESAASDVAKAVGVPAWSVAASRKRVADLYTTMGNATEAAKWR